MQVGPRTDPHKIPKRKKNATLPSGLPRRESAPQSTAFCRCCCARARRGLSPRGGGGSRLQRMSTRHVASSPKPHLALRSPSPWEPTRTATTSSHFHHRFRSEPNPPLASWTPRESRSPVVACSAAQRLQPPRGAEGRRSLRADSAPSTSTSTRRRGRGPWCKNWPSSPSWCWGASSSFPPRTSATPTTHAAAGSPSTARATPRYGAARHACLTLSSVCVFRLLGVGHGIG
jgi:hypothetical protein